MTPNNEWGANADPVTGEPCGAEQDIIGALQSHLNSLYAILNMGAGGALVDAPTGRV